jgi:hypothetical protein
LRAQIESLLTAHDHPDSLLEVPACNATIDVPPPMTERPGTMIGPYKLLQQIGEGGMGTVFMAEQTHPVQRKVALKVIKAGMDSGQVIARFEAERQASCCRRDWLDGAKRWGSDSQKDCDCRRMPCGSGDRTRAGWEHKPISHGDRHFERYAEDEPVIIPRLSFCISPSLFSTLRFSFVLPTLYADKWFRSSGLKRQQKSTGRCEATSQTAYYKAVGKFKSRSQFRGPPRSSNDWHRQIHSGILVFVPSHAIPKAPTTRGTGEIQMPRARFALFVTLLTVAAGCQKRGPSTPPAPAATRDGRWRQDISYVCDNVSRLHPDPFRFASRQKYEAARDDLLERVPELPDTAIVVRLAAILAQLGDAHTNLFIDGPLFPMAPLRVLPASDGFFLIAAPMQHKDLLGAKLVQLGDAAMDEALERIATVVSHESDDRVHLFFPRLVRMPPVLHELGLASRTDAVRLGVETTDGVQTVEFKFVPVAEPETLAWLERQDVPLPEQRADENYWRQTIPEHQAVYLAYNKCREEEDRPFREFAAEVLEELENPGIKRLIIDLRRNGGGDELLASPLIEKLPRHRLDRPGGIVVLIGLLTYSSGQNHAVTLRNTTQAVLIGERTSQYVNHFGSITSFQSPNYKLTVQCSTKYIEKDPEVDGVLVPDVEVRSNFEDWKQGADPALEAALAYDPQTAEQSPDADD